MLNIDKSRISYQVLYAEILYHTGKQEKALAKLDKLLALNPDNHPVTMTYVDLLLEKGDYRRATSELKKHTLVRRSDPNTWQKLSESEGKSGNQVAMYQARAEFLYLTGQKKKALQQLKLALDLSKDQYQTAARIEQRAREMAQAPDSLEF